MAELMERSLLLNKHVNVLPGVRKTRLEQKPEWQAYFKTQLEKGKTTQVQFKTQQRSPQLFYKSKPEEELKKQVPNREERMKFILFHNTEELRSVAK